MLNIIERFVKNNGWSYGRLDGSTPVGTRQASGKRRSIIVCTMHTLTKCACFVRDFFEMLAIINFLVPEPHSRQWG